MSDFITKPVTPEQPVAVTPAAPIVPVPAPRSRFAALQQFYTDNHWYVWAIVAAVVVIAVLAFIAFRPQRAQPTQPANVAVTIDAPSTAPSGGEVIYKVKVENKDSQTLTDMSLELVYPNGVTYSSSQPTASNLSGTTFPVPDLVSGQNAVILVRVVAQGNINEDKVLLVRLRYKFSNFSSEFVAEGKQQLRLVAADIILELNGPSQTTNTEVVSYDVTYRNGSSKPVTGARVQLQYPDRFVFADSSPKPNLGQNVWNIGNLQPGDSGRITVQGSFSSANPGEQQTVGASFLVLDDQGAFFTQAATTAITAITATPLLVSQTVSGATSGDSSIVDPGSQLSYTINFQNNAAVVATGVTIVATVDPKFADLSSIRAESGNVQDNTVTWTAAGLASLERLNPNEKGSTRFSVAVNKTLYGGGAKNVTVVSSVKIKANEYPFFNGNDIKLKASSPSSLSRAVTFSSGQLPLKVGLATELQVSLSLKNQTNDYKNAVLTGFVPSGVTLDVSSLTPREKSLITYDASTGKLTWNIGQLLASGDSVSRSLAFKVRFTPTQTQQGQAITLLKTIAFIATDGFTDKTVNLTLEPIQSSDIDNGSNVGRVQ